MGKSKLKEQDSTKKKLHTVVCRVVSDKMNKSRVAAVDRLVKHPRVKKYIRLTGKLMFHDEENTSKSGDKVLVQPCRPISGRKRFRLIEVLERSKAVDMSGDEFAPAEGKE